MKEYKSHLLRQLSYVFSAQLIVFLSSFVKTLIVPVVLGIDDYGYWQLYIFYTAYIGLFTLGYSDGAYLKYGGYLFKNLPINNIRNGNLIYITVLLFGALLVLFFGVLSSGYDRSLVFYAVAMNVLVLGISSNVALLLQATDSLKSYSILVAADKLFFCLALLLLVDEYFQSFYYLIFIDLISKLLILFFMLKKNSSLFFSLSVDKSSGYHEFMNNCRSGSKLLVANLSAMLITGVGRLIIEYAGDLKSYAVYAFSTSMSGVVLMFITVLSVVFFPTLKRRPRNEYKSIFNKSRAYYSILSVALLGFYFPAFYYIEFFANEFEATKTILNVMFVIVIFQGKMQLLFNTFYKALRLEREMLMANISALILVVIFSFPIYKLTKEIDSIAYTTLIVMMLRIYFSEARLVKYLKGNFGNISLVEFSILVIFLLSTSLLEPLQSFIIWLISFIILVVSKRDTLRILVNR